MKAVVSAAWAAVRVKNSYWHALFERMRKRMKAQKAIVAIARRMFINIESEDYIWQQSL
ncbi:MAG: hypothetical protein ACTHNW_20885 [Mucilaginibacter sp.]